MAVKLAEHYGADVKKAELAGLVHDCAKDLSMDECLELAKRHGYEPDEISLRNMSLLHAPLGAYLAKELFHIEDEEIQGAIAYHTTGRKDMTLLEKIIFLADYIEEGSSFPGVEELRELAFIDLNRAILTSLEFSIHNVMKRGRLLHPLTVEARNSLILEMQDPT